jgi:hypothetical protein
LGRSKGTKMNEIILNYTLLSSSRTRRREIVIVLGRIQPRLR